MSSLSRLSEYRIMWVFVLFDLPTNTKAEKRAYIEFKKYLENDGFTMFQYSVYIRHCASAENAEVHVKRVSDNLPKYGLVVIFQLTDKQFGNIKVYESHKPKPPNSPGQQLELF